MHKSAMASTPNVGEVQKAFMIQIAVLIKYYREDI